MLTVPVGVFATNSNQLLIVGGGTYTFVPWPIPPFSLVQMREGEKDAERIKLIGGGEAFVGIEYVPALPVEVRAGRKQELPSLDYPLELIKEFPEQLRQLTRALQHTGMIEPYPLFIDIETASTEEHFPTPERDPIIAIQVKYPDSDIAILLNEDMTDYSEYMMLLEFLDWVTISPGNKTPDVIVGYNLNRFDIPYIKTRIHKLRRKYPDLGQKFDSLSRAPRAEASERSYTVFYSGWLFSGKLPGEVLDFVPGLLTLDLFVHAKTDLALQALPSRSLKNVATAYGCEVFDLARAEKQNMAELLKENKERFTRYARSDIVATEYVYTIYKTRLEASSNLLVCPMSMAHRMSSGQKSYLALYRECRKNGYYSFRKNEQRYGDMYARSSQYQGAIVACYRRGYFPRTVYLDAKSLYPNIMHDFNVSYDRYTLLEKIEYSAWRSELETIPLDARRQVPLSPQYREGDPCIVSYGPVTGRIIYIPDDNYKLVLKFMVNLANDGFMRKLINHYNDVRDEFKKKSKEFAKKYQETGNVMYRVESMNYDSTQAEAKIINNTFYGIQGNRYYDIADLPAAICITALGRWLMTEMVRLFGKNAILELDSVTGDTPIYVKSKTTGMIDIITLADLHADPSIKRIAYGGEYQVLSRNGWADIQYTKAHAVRKNIHRIKLSDGSVDCTADHSLFDADTHEKLSPVRMHPGTRIERTNLPDPGDGIMETGDFPLDSRLAWFYGLFLAKGSYTVWYDVKKTKKPGGSYSASKRTNRILSLSVRTRSSAEMAQSICNELVSPYCSSPESEKPAVVHIYAARNRNASCRLTGFTNKTAMEFFMKHFYCNDGITKKIPPALLNCQDHDILNSFMSGYVADDGYDCVNSHSRKKKQVYTSKDAPLVAGLRYLLKRLDNDTCLVKRKDKRNSTEIQVCQSGTHGTTCAIDKSRVLSNTILIPDSEETRVYDVCTSDGTFVGAMGEIVLKNTDGVLLNQEYFNLNIADINTQLCARINEFFGVPYEKMNFTLEFEDDGSVYMYKRKNYILRKNSDPAKLVTKGSAFKGYDKAPVIQRAVRLLADAVMFHDNDPQVYEHACRDARDVRGVFEREGLAPFKFTKTLKKDPQSYKGYQNVEVYTLSVDRSGTLKQVLDAMKKRALCWVDTVFGKKIKNKKTRGDNFRDIIKACKNEEEMKLALGLMAFAQPMKERSHSYHFLLDLVMRLQQRGRTVEAYDVLEYYYTRTAEQYTLEEDMQPHLLNFEKYREEIDSIIKRFIYGDSKRKLLTLHELLDDDADEENSNEGYEHPDSGDDTA